MFYCIPFFSKTFGNSFFCLFIFQQILTSSCTTSVWILFKLVAQIFLNAFTKMSPLCFCTVKTTHPTHGPLAMLKWDQVAVTLAAGIVNVLKITAWERQILLQNQVLDLKTMDGGHWKECKCKIQYSIILKNETLGKCQSIYSELCIGIILTFVDLFSLEIHIYFKTGAK